MELFDTLRTQRSVRAFTGDPVTDEDLERILEAASWAPNAANRQVWELSERAHEGIATLGYRPGPYSNREELLVGFDRFVLERLSRKDGA